MIELTDEMVRAYSDARAALNQEQTHGRPPIGEDGKCRAGLAAVLAIVERDRCLEPRGHACRDSEADEVIPCALATPHRGHRWVQLPGHWRTCEGVRITGSHSSAGTS